MYIKKRQIFFISIDRRSRWVSASEGGVKREDPGYVTYSSCGNGSFGIGVQHNKYKIQLFRLPSFRGTHPRQSHKSFRNAKY